MSVPPTVSGSERNQTSALLFISFKINKVRESTWFTTGAWGQTGGTTVYDNYSGISVVVAIIVM